MKECCKKKTKKIFSEAPTWKEMPEEWECPICRLRYKKGKHTIYPHDADKKTIKKLEREALKRKRCNE